MKINMRTIMISDQAYEALARIKGKKSFTELLLSLVERLKQNDTNTIMRFAGILNDDEAEELKDIVTKIRARAKARI